MVKVPRRTAREPLRWSYLGHEVVVEFCHGAEAERSIRELRNQGASIPLQHQREWIWGQRGHETWFVSIRPDANAECTYGLAVRNTPRRALPGHRRLRVERFGATDDPVSAEVMLGVLKHLAYAEPRVLQIEVSVFSKDAEMLRRIEDYARALGYRELSGDGTYRATVAVDLRPEENEILASFTTRARRGIRAPAKRGLEVKVITDVELAQRMGALRQESMRRTGVDSPGFDFEPYIALAGNHPELLRVVGTFDPRVGGPEALVGYAIGEMHGDHVTYSHAACLPAAVSNAPITHAPTWDLMRWARRNGATWFDFGGISMPDGDTRDPLRGVSDFKKTFSSDIVRVGDTWILEPRPVRARLAAAIGACVAGVSRRSQWSQRSRSG